MLFVRFISKRALCWRKLGLLFSVQGVVGRDQGGDTANGRVIARLGRRLPSSGGGFAGRGVDYGTCNGGHGVSRGVSPIGYRGRDN